MMFHPSEKHKLTNVQAELHGRTTASRHPARSPRGLGLAGPSHGQGRSAQHLAGKKPEHCVSCTATNADCSKTDSVKSYVSEAIKNGFAIIDVNLPKHITDDDVSGSLASLSSRSVLTSV